MRGAASFLVVGVVLNACNCDRRTFISGRFAEMVVVQTGAAGAEQLVRDAVIPLPRAVMTESSSGTFAVRNIGDGKLTLTKISLAEGSTAFALELPDRVELEPTESATFTATFSPEQANDASQLTVGHEATFLLEGTGGRNGDEKATITLVAVAEARDCYVPALLDFGEAPIGQTVSIPLALSNATSTPAQAAISAMTGPNPAFFSTGSTGSVELAPQTPSSVEVRFAPVTEMPVTAQFSVQRRASCPAVTVTLTGRGSSQAMTWLPTELNFGRVPLNETASRVVTFSNLSGAALSMSISTEGTDFATPSPTGTLPPRATAQVVVSCTPTSLSALNGTLKVELGTSPRLPVRIPVRCSGGGPRLRVTPSALAFGTVPFLEDAQGRPASSQPAVVRRLRFENVGTPPPSPTDTSFHLVLGRDGMPPLMSLTPGNSTSHSEFRVGLISYAPLGVPAVAGKNAIDVEVMLRPASIGLKDAVLTVYSNDAVQPVQTVRLSASAVKSPGPCAVASIPSSIPFGDVSPESSSTKTLTFTNTSALPCLVAGLEIAPGSSNGFALASTTPASINLGPGQSLPISVTFNSTGLEVGTTAGGFVRYVHPGLTTPQLIPLSARVAQCIVMVPDEVDFGNIKIGCRSAPRSVQVFNTCGTPARIMSASIIGQPFAITSQPTVGQGGVVQPSGSATYSIVFGPIESLGQFTGTFRLVSHSGTTLTSDLPLKGVGDSTGTTTETWSQPLQPQSDILFTIDNSCSMADKQMALASNFQSFIRYATTANVDYRIAVTTTDDFVTTGQGQFVQQAGAPLFLTSSTPMIDQLFGARVNVGISGSGFERPLSTTLKALTEPLRSGANAGFLRDDANLAIIIVSDAPDQSTEPIDYYLSRLPFVKGVRRVHQVNVSVIGPFSRPTTACTIETTDDGRYRALVAKTGGVQGNICTTNWASELETLGRSALGPRTSFFVKNPPDTAQPIDVSVNGQPVSNAWTYDRAANSIVFQAGQAPGAGTTLTVSYQSQCL